MKINVESEHNLGDHIFYIDELQVRKHAFGVCEIEVGFISVHFSGSPEKNDHHVEYSSWDDHDDAICYMDEMCNTKKTVEEIIDVLEFSFHPSNDDRFVVWNETQRFGSRKVWTVIKRCEPKSLNPLKYSEFEQSNNPVKWEQAKIHLVELMKEASNHNFKKRFSGDFFGLNKLLKVI